MLCQNVLGQHINVDFVVCAKTPTSNGHINQGELCLAFPRKLNSFCPLPFVENLGTLIGASSLEHGRPLQIPQSINQNNFVLASIDELASADISALW